MQISILFCDGVGVVAIGCSAQILSRRFSTVSTELPPFFKASKFCTMFSFSKTKKTGVVVDDLDDDSVFM